jgi:hypothetical protein
MFAPRKSKEHLMASLRKSAAEKDAFDARAEIDRVIVPSSRFGERLSRIE